MARIDSYPSDTTPEGSDILLGNGANSGQTKVFTLDNLSSWMSQYGNIAVLGQTNFKMYSTVDNDTKGAIQIAGGAQSALFSEVTSVNISKTDIGTRYIADYIPTLLNKSVILSQIDGINNFGTYTVTSISQHPSLSNFYVMNLSFTTGNGSMTEDKIYGNATQGAESDDAPRQLYPIKSENDSLFDIGITNNGELIVIPEGSFEPVIASPPVITGTLKVWYTLGAIAGGATGAPTPIRTWQWQRSDTGLNWVDIDGATNATYTLTIDDADKRIRVQQTETNVLGSVTSSSDLTEAITPSIFKDTEWQNITPVTWGALTVQTWN